jgi:hypothetical protein
VLVSSHDSIQPLQAAVSWISLGGMPLPSAKIGESLALIPDFGIIVAPSLAEKLDLSPKGVSDGLNPTVRFPSLLPGSISRLFYGGVSTALMLFKFMISFPTPRSAVGGGSISNLSK